MDTKPKSVKEKRRNNEKRKEKSRDAARCRRSRETEIFTDLSSALPLPQDQVSQLDKASIMRLAISYLRVRGMINLLPDLEPPTKHDISVDESTFLKAMDGFVLVISSEGDLIYVSENVTEYLGITQIEFMGQNIYEYSHPCDHDEIKEILSNRTQDAADSQSKSFFLRFKCTLTSKGRSVNLKSATYKVIHCTGHVVYQEDQKENSDQTDRCFVAVGQPIPHPSNIEAPLPTQTFLTKHSLDMKFTYTDEKMLEFLDYEEEDLLGKSVYEYHHATDSDSIATTFKSLFSKGQCETNRYRFLAKTGGYIWVVTQATLIYDKIQKPQSVVCVNYVISGIENKDEIYAAFQLLPIKKECSSPLNTAEAAEKDQNTKRNVEGNKKTAKISAIKKNITNNNVEIVKPSIVTSKLFTQVENSAAIIPRPQTATSKIFAPRTEEMSKGFLTFSEEEPGLTLLKDEPDDLTHLAPVAGDVVLLDDNTFLPEMLDDFLLRDGFCPLLNDDPIDPFMSYRDSCDPSPQLLSPNTLKNSECSMQSSLNSPTNSIMDEDHMSTFIGLPSEEDPELIMKAPYIPMTMGDDLPLLLPGDVMWNSVDKNKDNTPENTSSLAQLLSSGVSKHTSECNDHGGIEIQNNFLDGRYDKSSTGWGLPKLSPLSNNKIEETKQSINNKRSHNSIYNISNKRTKCDVKDNVSSELLQQLISDNHNRNPPKTKNHWLLDGGGRKSTCVSQPSDSVLMNLLDESIQRKINGERLQKKYMDIDDTSQQENPDLSEKLRKTSISLLSAEPIGIRSLLDLTQQDYEVNAPVNNSLLQGEELITALETSSNI